MQLQAVANSLDDFDGSFTYLVATPEAIGYARDPFAFKPLITVETPNYVAIANEEIAGYLPQLIAKAGIDHPSPANIIVKRPA